MFRPTTFLLETVTPTANFLKFELSVVLKNSLYLRFKQQPKLNPNLCGYVN
jgi:hypothetical protein